MRQGIGDSATGIKERLFGREADGGTGVPAAEVAFDHLTEMVQIDDHGLDFFVGQAIDRPVDQAAVAYLDQGFRFLVGDRAHAKAHSGRQYHGSLGHPGTHWAAVRQGGTMRASAG